MALWKHSTMKNKNQTYPDASQNYENCNPWKVEITDGSLFSFSLDKTSNSICETPCLLDIQIITAVSANRFAITFTSGFHIASLLEYSTWQHSQK